MVLGSMNKIPLFLVTFRDLVRNKSFNSEPNEHPVLYFESEEQGMIYFYKPIGSVIYCLEIAFDGLPENITLDGLKTEFQAIEIPQKLDNDIKLNKIAS